MLVLKIVGCVLAVIIIFFVALWVASVFKRRSDDAKSLNDVPDSSAPPAYRIKNDPNYTWRMYNDDKEKEGRAHYITSHRDDTSGDSEG